MMNTIDAELQAGLAASRSGDKEQARACYIRALKHDPGNQTAWLRLSSVMPTVEQALRCVEHLLTINPRHAQALEAREVLQVRLLLEEAAVVQTPAPPASTPQRRYLLGEALVEARVLTQQQLDAALVEQRRLAQKKKPMRLGEVLLRMKLVRPEQLEAAVASQIESMPSAPDAGVTGQLGDYLLRRNLVTRAQLLQGLAQQNELKRQGRPMLLGDVLVRCGYIQREQLNRALVEWQQHYDTCFR
jgi:tetratricopeptide (TPR) repeat protein